MPTPNVFDFDVDRLADYRPERIDSVLDEQPELYVNHLTIAKSIEGWAERLLDRSSASSDEQFDKGYAQALREVAAHLRQADYVRGGPMLS